jgi:hypothetical protein
MEINARESEYRRFDMTAVVIMTKIVGFGEKVRERQI